TCGTDTDEEIQQHSEADSNILENWQEYLADNPTQTNNENHDTNELESTSQNRQLINLGQNNETSEDEKEGYWSETRHSNNSSDDQIITDDLERTGSNNNEILGLNSGDENVSVRSDDSSVPDLYQIDQNWDLHVINNLNNYDNQEYLQGTDEEIPSEVSTEATGNENESDDDMDGVVQAIGNLPVEPLDRTNQTTIIDGIIKLLIMDRCVMIVEKLVTYAQIVQMPIETKLVEIIDENARQDNLTSNSQSTNNQLLQQLQVLTDIIQANTNGNDGCTYLGTHEYYPAERSKPKERFNPTAKQHNTRSKDKQKEEMTDPPVNEKYPTTRLTQLLQSKRTNQKNLEKKNFLMYTTTENDWQTTRPRTWRTEFPVERPDYSK
ncbi:7985_t:CDS:2, partial [Ambispora gerdemannii]